MTEALAQILALGTQSLQLWFVVLLRVGSMMALTPGFGERSIPTQFRLIIAFAFTLVVTPAVSETLSARIAEQGLSAWILLETLIGLSMGAMLRFFVIALQLAGTIAAQATSLSQLFGGTGGEPQPAIGNLLMLGALAFAMGLGLHVRLAEFLIQSYDAMPIGTLPNLVILKDWGVSGVSRAFSQAFVLAAPFVIAGLIYNVALGAINRAMPQLMVAFVGAPALTAGGLILLAISGPMAIQVWHGAFLDFFANPFEVSR